MSILPRLVWEQLRSRCFGIPCFIITGSQLAMFLAKASSRLCGIKVEWLQFRYIDIRDDEGRFINPRIQHQDLAKALQYVVDEPLFKAVAQDGTWRNRLSTFLAKQVVSAPLMNRRSFVVWDALNLIQVSLFKTKEEFGATSVPVMFLEPRPWFKAIVRYASDFGVAIVPIRGAPNVAATLRRRTPSVAVSLVRAIRYPRARKYFIASIRRKILSGRTSDNPHPGTETIRNNSPTARVAVPYYGHLHLDNPERHSDLFFWQQSSLPGRDVLVNFASPNVPLDQDKLAQLQHHGIGVAVLHPGATTILEMPVFPGRPSAIPSRRAERLTKGQGAEGTWLRQQIAAYEGMRDYWSKFFAHHKVKVFTTWWKNDSTHCAVGDALQDVGGVMAIYQRSFEELPTAQLTVDSDIVFGFSPEVAKVESGSNSTIRYHVATGFLGDHRFALLRSKAEIMRASLRAKGASRIMAFTDESTRDDPRWELGHEFARAEYLFLLEKVLAEPWFGLLIKPKMPRTLRQRLGPVADVLDRAVSTGRCHVYQEESVSQSSQPPCEAALAADVAVHGHLVAGAAAVEMALAGTPTLMLDREGWPSSPLYRLGVGKVIFNDFETLWEACREHWSSSNGIPGFGDWSSLMVELDPFRDGRAAERMGTYIHWLLEGFRAGLDRETVMADAAERYCAIWGRDKINQVGRQPGVSGEQQLLSHSVA